MASVDKVKISDTTYDVSPSATGTLNGYTSGDSTSPSNWSSVDVISTSDTNSSIFNKITTMVQNVRWLYTKLGNDDFSDAGSDTITGALSTLQGGLDGKSPMSHTHTTMTLPVSSNQVNSENYVPTSALLYSMVQRANDVADRVTMANEILNPPIDIGTTWLYEEDGSFKVPVTGTYQVEMHGGGGGGGGGTGGSSRLPGGAGGGSGNLFTVELTKGDVIPVTIGAGGKGGEYAGSSTHTNIDGETGGTTIFGDYSLAGGGGGLCGDTDSPGAASGNIAQKGNTVGVYESYAIGGDGNKNNPDQTYGDGGNGAQAYEAGEAGQPGAVIVTFMGKTD